MMDWSLFYRPVQWSSGSLLWLLLSAFVGVNMFQAAVTGFCPLIRILNALKVEQCTSVSPLR